jgi:hypothetical protein
LTQIGLQCRSDFFTHDPKRKGVIENLLIIQGLMLSATLRNALRGCARLVLFHTPHPLFIIVNAQINSLFIFADHNDRDKCVVGRVAANPAVLDDRIRHTVCLEMWLKRQVDRNDAVK